VRGAERGKKTNEESFRKLFAEIRGEVVRKRASGPRPEIRERRLECIGAGSEGEMRKKETKEVSNQSGSI